MNGAGVPLAPRYPILVPDTPSGTRGCGCGVPGVGVEGLRQWSPGQGIEGKDRSKKFLKLNYLNIKVV